MTGMVIILTHRLQKLAEHGVIEKKPISPGARRFAYQLTAKGRALRPVLAAMVAWSLEHEPGTRRGLTPDS